MSEHEQRLIVGFYPNVNKKKRRRIHKRMGAKVILEIEQIHANVITVPQDRVETSMSLYALNKNVRYVEHDHLAQATDDRPASAVVPNDPSFALQWGLTKIKAERAWDNAVIGPSNIGIAILDTGIDQNHPDLASRITRNVNFTDSTTVDDLYGHGTHVAGIAAAISNNGINGAGISFNVGDLWNLKVLADDGFGFYSWIASAITFAADEGASVINMSLSGSSPAQILEDAVLYAWQNGVVIAAAAGNSNSSSPEYPAAYEKVISVAATDQNDLKASFSNFGDGVDVAAPGVQIYSTCPNHANTIGCLNFGSLNGTSMAAPFVAGLAALIKATFPSLNKRKIRRAIEKSTETVPGTGTLYKFGRIHAARAIKKAGNFAS